MKRILGLALAAALTTSMAGTAALAAPNDKANPRAHEVAAQNNGQAKGKGKVPDARTVPVQVLQFSDFHGHLTPTSGFGGAAHLAGLIDELSASFEADNKHGVSYTVSSGDSIGGSTFESGLFQDEPTIEILNTMGLTASAVGNHEFDEGVTELMRIVEGGDHPELGQFGDQPYAGTDFPYLAANVVSRETGEPILPPYVIESHKGVKVGFIGVITDTTSALVSPGGISSVEFLDEAETINRYAAELQSQGVEAIVATVHEGGDDNGTYPSPVTSADVNAGCDTLTGAIVDINAATTPAVDVLLSGHSHNAFACLVDDPAGADRPVIGPGDWGRVLSETTFAVDRRTKDVLRDTVAVENHVVDTASVTPDAEVQAIVDRWVAEAAVVGEQVIGNSAQPITGDSSGDRGIETPMANLVADAILWGTQESGAQIAFMNVGGVRASLDLGDVTYREAYNVAPFGNLLVTIEMTGQQIQDVLEQQWQPIPARGTRPMLALGVSEGFTYEWDAATHTVVPGSMELNGTPIDLNATYRVGTLNFLAEGGDSFTVFTEGTFVAGGPEDLANLVAYIRENSPLTLPGDRVAGL